MAETYTGVMKVPGTRSKAEVKPSNILYSYANLVLKGVTLADGAGVIEAGTVLGRVTATKKYVAYADGALDGSQTAVGVLLEDVDVTNGDALGNIVLGGELIRSALVGLDAAAITELNGRVDTANDRFSF